MGDISLTFASGLRSVSGAEILSPEGDTFNSPGRKPWDPSNMNIGTPSGAEWVADEPHVCTVKSPTNTMLTVHKSATPPAGGVLVIILYAGSQGLRLGLMSVPPVRAEYFAVVPTSS